MRRFGVLTLGVAACIAGCNGADDTIDGGELDGGTIVRPDGSRDAGRPPVDEPCATPGALEETACGRCGTARRFCSSAQVWEYGPCMNETGTCNPGDTRSGSCGNCGSQQEVCTEQCAWQPLGECSGEGICTPGEVVRSREGCATGQRDLRCTDACVLEPASECSVESCTSPGTTETVACGNCGTRTRFCTSAREWEYGPCGAQGTCEPGTSQTMACGNCGTQTMRCNDRCTWTAFGSCTGQGACAPGSTGRGTEGCPEGESRALTCNDACSYEPAGACEAQATGAVGQRCGAGNRCQTGLVCRTDTGVPICRRPCATDNDCPNTTTFCIGQTTCSDACNIFTDSGCPDGTKCDFVGGVGGGLSTSAIAVCGAIGTGTQGSTCTTNAQCARRFACTIRSGSVGQCERVCDAVNPCPSGLTCDSGTTLPLPIPVLGAGTCR